MGLLRDIASVATGIPIPGGKRSNSNNSSDQGDQDQDKTGSDYGETYGQQTIRRVKRATKRIGNGRE
jgi:hypothetical protein